MKLTEIKKNIEEIKNKNKSDFQEKRNQIILELDHLLVKEKALFDIITEYETAKRVVNSDDHLYNNVIDENWKFKLGKLFEPILNKTDNYQNEYYDFIFKLHQMICSPNLYNKSMQHYNYLIPLSYDAKENFSPSDACLVDVCASHSIDVEFYQFWLLKIWAKNLDQQIQGLNYRDICNQFLNETPILHYSDIAVTKTSKGKSRVENSLDQIEKIFKKVNIINNKKQLTQFGTFVLAIIKTYPHPDLKDPSFFRGKKGLSKVLSKPINDVIFNFDLSDLDKLNYKKSTNELLKLQINKFKTDPKNIEIYEMTNYID